MPEQQTTTVPIVNMRDRFLRFIEGDGTETPGAPAGGVVEPPAAPVPAPPAPVEPAPAANVWDDPAAARAEIEKLRRENGADRVNAKTAAAEEARTELLQKLGLTKDGADKPDPDALAKDLASARETAKETSIKLAVYRAAAANKANPDALLDSASFLAKVRTLDPTGADFATQVNDAITAAVTSNPILKATQAVGASGVDLGGGTGEQGQITEAQLARMTPDQIVDAQSKGLLRSLLG
jgi:hypothetical protein